MHETHLVPPDALVVGGDGTLDSRKGRPTFVTVASLVAKRLTPSCHVLPLDRWGSSKDVAGLDVMSGPPDSRSFPSSDLPGRCRTSPR